MNRRKFLGAAAALAALPSDVSATRDGVPDNSQPEDVETNDLGPREGKLWVAYETFADVDEDATYSVYSISSDPNYAAGFVVSGAFGSIRSDMTAEKAEQLGRQLIDAAREGR